MKEGEKMEKLEQQEVLDVLFCVMDEAKYKTI